MSVIDDIGKGFRTFGDMLQSVRETINKGVDEEILDPIDKGVTKAWDDAGNAIGGAIGGAIWDGVVGGMAVEDGVETMGQVMQQAQKGAASEDWAEDPVVDVPQQMYDPEHEAEVSGAPSLYTDFLALQKAALEVMAGRKDLSRIGSSGDLDDYERFAAAQTALLKKEAAVEEMLAKPGVTADMLPAGYA